MLDIKFIRDNPDTVKKAVKDKMLEVDIDRLLKLDEERRQLIARRDELKAEQNQAGEKIAKASGDEKAKLVADMKSVAEEVHSLKDKLQAVESEYEAIMLSVPQIPAKDAPIGDESANKVIKTVGDIPKFDFKTKDHMELGAELNIIDSERGVKLMGTRGYVLKNEGARLELALMNYALDFLRERGFTQLSTPVLAREQFFKGTGHFPFAKEETFKVYDQRDDMEEPPLYLIGTSEVPLMGYHADEIIDSESLPLKYCAFTNCFRTEVGSYGKDTQGLYRVKEFKKVEQVILMKNDISESIKMLHKILEFAEQFLSSLELPYQILQIATGDMGAGKVEMYDIETYMPSRESYGETHSASLLGDWQARRLNIRYKDGNTKKFCHTLNNTLIASPRILIALLENHQQEDGSVNIPQALRPYMDGMSRLKK